MVLRCVSNPMMTKPLFNHTLPFKLLKKKIHKFKMAQIGVSWKSAACQSIDCIEFRQVFFWHVLFFLFWQTVSQQSRVLSASALPLVYKYDHLHVNCYNEWPKWAAEKQFESAISFPLIGPRLLFSMQKLKSDWKTTRAVTVNRFKNTRAHFLLLFPGRLSMFCETCVTVS